MSMPQRLVGYIDPTVLATNEYAQQLLREVARRGLCLHRVHPSGSSVRIAGKGIFMLTEIAGSAAIGALQVLKAHEPIVSS
ncbi:MAG: hypothetical protein IPP87_17420, partial [Ideonella sp.]|nr:hypothetical protein [Ideonella sp.]